MSDDLISRQWLIDNIEKGEEVKGGAFDTDSDSVKNFINVAPTIDIVRCKECKHWQKSRERAVMCCLREVPNRPMKADDYCSYGEREGE